MSEKLINQNSIRFSDATADLLTRLAHIEGKKTPELVRGLVDSYVKAQYDHYILLQSAFKNYEITGSQCDPVKSEQGDLYGTN